MNKFTYAGISLIGAIPGGYLSYLMVMAMIDHFSKMGGMMRTLTGLTLAASAVVAVMPLGIIVFASNPKSEEDEEGTDALSDEEILDEETEPAEFMEEDALDADEEEAEADHDAPGTAGEDLEQSVVMESMGSADSEESVVLDTEGMFDDDIYDAEDEEESK